MTMCEQVVLNLSMPASDGPLEQKKKNHNSFLPFPVHSRTHRLGVSVDLVRSSGPEGTPTFLKNTLDR